MTSFSKTAKKRIIYFLSLMALLAWLGHLHMRYYYYAAVAPRKYDAATGHIFEISNHGDIFYLNTEQLLWTYFPLIFVGLFMLAVFLLERRWQIYKELNELRFKPLKPY
jgi:hypothetical protein